MATPARALTETLNRLTVICIVAFLIPAHHLLADGRLVLSTTQRLDERVDQEFEITAANWINDNTLGLLTADGSVFLLEHDRIVQTIPSQRTAFNANAFAVSRDASVAAVATSTGLIAYDPARRTAIQNPLHGALLAVGFRGMAILIAVGPHGISMLEKVADHYTLGSHLETAKLYAAAVDADGSRIAILDSKHNLVLFDVIGNRTVRPSCTVPKVGLSSRIVVSSAGVLIVINDRDSGRVLQVDTNCRVRELLAMPSGRILGMSASVSDLVVRTAEGIEVWSVQQPHRTAVLNDSRGMGVMAMSPDGRTVAIVTHGTIVQFWKVSE